MSREDTDLNAEEHYRRFLASLDPSLAKGETPKRVVEMMGEWTATSRARALPALSVFDAPSPTDWVGMKGLRFYSFCEHHMVPFFGTVDLAFLPGAKIIGFSAVTRLLGHLSKRPQLQEGLVSDFADALDDALAPEGLFVRLRARQLCMEMRGHPAPVICVSTARRGRCRDAGGHDAAVSVLNVQEVVAL